MISTWVARGLVFLGAVLLILFLLPMLPCLVIWLGIILPRLAGSSHTFRVSDRGIVVDGGEWGMEIAWDDLTAVELMSIDGSGFGDHPGIRFVTTNGSFEFGWLGSRGRDELIRHLQALDGFDHEALARANRALAWWGWPQCEIIWARPTGAGSAPQSEPSGQ